MSDTDKRRKAQVPIKRLPSPVEWILKNATGQQLDYLDRMARSQEFSVFINLISRFKEYNVYEVYRFVAKDEKELAYFRAGKIGEVAGLDAIILASQAARDEITRRKRMKEVLHEST